METAHRRDLVSALTRFVVTGGLSVGLDVAVLTTLRSGLGVALVTATTAGYLASLVVNYSLNHAWVFQSQGEHHRRIAKYVSLVVVNYALTIGVVTGLVALGAHYLVAKLVVVVLNACLNFTLFRSWVFTTR